MLSQKALGIDYSRKKYFKNLNVFLEEWLNKLYSSTHENIRTIKNNVLVKKLIVLISQIYCKE